MNLFLFLFSCSPVVEDTSSTNTTPTTTETTVAHIATAPELANTNQDPTTVMPICINEFVAANERSLVLEETAPDWIELHNPTSTDISLQGWTISDDAQEPDPHELSGDLVVPARGFLLLYADNTPLLGDDHLSFKLAVDGEALVLTAPNGRQSHLVYPELEKDIAAQRTSDCCQSPSCWTYDWFGTPGVSNIDPDDLKYEEEELLAPGSTWGYHDMGTGLGPNWFTGAFDNSSWESGPAPLGYGDKHIVTAVDFGPDTLNKYTTTYFRTTFEVADPAAVDELMIDLMRDDGALVYLNGTEVIRSNMPAGVVLYNTAAAVGVAAPEESTFFSATIGADLLVVGENLLAAEVHQATPDSTDMAFDLGIVGLVLIEPEPTEEGDLPPQSWLMIENLPHYDILLPRPCASVYDQDILPEYSIEIDNEELQLMMFEYNNFGYNTAGELKPYHPLISFEYDGEVIEDAQIRLKGNPCCSWVTGEKLQFTMRFDGIDDGGRFQGLRHIALDGPWYDVSALRERLSHSYFRDDMGLPGSCANNARLVINGEFYGLYANIEFLDEELLERNFGNGGPDEGYLYKYDYTEGKWECKEGGDEDDLTAFNELYSLNSPGAIIKGFDLETYFRHVAADATTPLADNYNIGSINFAWYQHPDRGWMLLPWDHDYAFQYYSDWDPLVHESWGDFQDHLTILKSHPDSYNHYVDALLEAYEAYDPEQLAARIDAWSAQIRPSVDEDPWVSVTEFDSEVGWLRDFVYARKAYLDWYWK